MGPFALTVILSHQLRLISNCCQLFQPNQILLDKDVFSGFGKQDAGLSKQVRDALLFAGILSMILVLTFYSCNTLKLSELQSEKCVPLFAERFVQFLFFQVKILNVTGHRILASSTTLALLK